MLQPTLTPARRQVLRDALPAAADCLRHDRMSELAEVMIEHYVEMDWMEWQGGALRLTITGLNVCKQVAAYAKNKSP